MSAPKMKPCQRCRSADRLAVYSYDSGWRHVECNGCGYLGPGEGSIRQAIRSHNERVTAALADERTQLADEITRLRAENERMREALTPSAETKGAYIGEFKFNTPIVNSKGQEEAFMTYVPWTTIKEIMAAIRARAALTPKGE